jgi:cellulose synthase/poly-beta-1,6-N-acetylglucosamine synthase-like glycosyltransferase
VVIAPPPAGEQPPRIAVVVPARDEAGNICRCLNSPLARNYPLSRFNVPVVDDHSYASELAENTSSAWATLAAALPASAAAFGLHIAAAFHFRIPFWYGLLFPVGYTIGTLMAHDSGADASAAKSAGKAGFIHDRRQR